MVCKRSFRQATRGSRDADKIKRERTGFSKGSLSAARVVAVLERCLRAREKGVKTARRDMAVTGDREVSEKERVGLSGQK